MKKCDTNYELSELAAILAGFEFEDININLKDEEIEFNDSIVFVSGSIYGIKDRISQPPYDDAIVEIICIFDDVVISYENQETKSLKSDELKQLETLTEKRFKL